jgi:hypothetical protein
MSERATQTVAQTSWTFCFRSKVAPTEPLTGQNQGIETKHRLTNFLLLHHFTRSGYD